MQNIETFISISSKPTHLKFSQLNNLSITAQVNSPTPFPRFFLWLLEGYKSKVTGFTKVFSGFGDLDRISIDWSYLTLGFLEQV